RRRADDAAVDEQAAGGADQGVGVARGLRRHRVEIGERDPAAGLLHRGGGFAGDRDRLAGVDDRDDKVAGCDQFFHGAAIVQAGRLGQAPGSLAAPVERDVHVHATFPDAGGDGLAHVARTDDADVADLHAVPFERRESACVRITDSRLMVIYLILFLGLLNWMSFMSSRVLMSLYAIQLGASPAAIGALIALYALGPVLLSVHAGKFCDRIG